MSLTENLEARPLPVAAVESLRCVWTAQPHRDGPRVRAHSRNCAAQVPLDVVADAWLAEMRRGRVLQGFFRFHYEGGLWLGYGLPDGCVRGVYCPAHSVERAARGDFGQPHRGPGLAPDDSGLARGASVPASRRRAIVRAGHLMLVD